jgi:hypothetical protein
MTDDLAGVIRSLPREAFREPSNRLAGLSYRERLLWLQQTAWFIWKHGGAAREDRGAGEGRQQRQ